MNAKGQLTMSAGGLPATALKNKVAMPATTADQGSAGDYAVDGDKLAVYLAGTGWIFFTGYQA